MLFIEELNHLWKIKILNLEGRTIYKAESNMYNYIYIINRITSTHLTKVLQISTKMLDFRLTYLF